MFAVPVDPPAIIHHIHDWYDPTCCGGNDCRPLTESEVKESPQGWLTPMGWVGYGDRRVKSSQDGRYHLCTGSRYTISPLDLGNRHMSPPRTPSPFLRCFYVPLRGT